MARSRKGGTPAVRIAEEARVLVSAPSYEHDPRSDSYALEAASALGLDPARVLKTLVCRLASGELVVAVLRSDRQLSLKALAAAAGTKQASMAPVPDAERATGYVAGGISPLGQRKRLRTFVDAAAAEHATVFVSGGRRGLEIELAPADLIRLANATVAPLA
jgi:Cys-tRNA(Pro)/Cys-tRNA(Cys) deacylase